MTRSLSRSTQAVYWLRANPGKTLREAAEQFGISHQAVSQVWKALNLGQTPKEKQWEDARRVALDLARKGCGLSEIVDSVSMSKTCVWRWCAEAGIEIKADDARKQKIRDAIEYVRNGGTIGGAAMLAGVTYGHMGRILRRHDALPGRHGRKNGGRHGLSAVASEVMDRDGLTMCEAAKRVGIAPNSVRSYRLRRGLPIHQEGEP